jgi:hypothetical protein
MSNWTILGFFKARWNLGETLGLSSICKCISSLKNCLKLSLDYGYNRLGQKGFQQLSDFRFLCPDKLEFLSLDFSFNALSNVSPIVAPLSFCTGLKELHLLFE